MKLWQQRRLPSRRRGAEQKLRGRAASAHRPTASQCSMLWLSWHHQTSDLCLHPRPPLLRRLGCPRRALHLPHRRWSPLGRRGEGFCITLFQIDLYVLACNHVVIGCMMHPTSNYLDIFLVYVRSGISVTSIWIMATTKSKWRGPCSQQRTDQLHLDSCLDVHSNYSPDGHYRKTIYCNTDSNAAAEISSGSFLDIHICRVSRSISVIQ